MMSRRPYPWLLLPCVLWSACAMPCESADPDVLARLLAFEGEVTRDTAATLEKWHPAAVDDEFREGDGLITGPKASAELQVGAGGKATVKPNSKLRFRRSSTLPGAGAATAATAAAAPAFELERGEATLEAGAQQELSFATAHGVARVERGSRVRLTPEAEGTHFQVLFGGMRVERDGKGGERLAEGEGTTLVGFGIAKMEHPVPVAKAGAAAVPATPQAAGAQSVQAVVEGKARYRAAVGDAWVEMEPGAARLAARTEVDVPAGSRMQIERNGELATLVGQGRYRIGDVDEGLVRTLEGGVEVQAGARDVTVQVPGGVIVARAVAGGTRASVQVDATSHTTTVHTETGEVQSKSADAEQTVAAGQAATLSHGSDDGEAAEGEDEAEPGEGAAEAPAASASGGATPTAGPLPESGGQVAQVDFVIPAGESLRVYDPSPPTALGIEVPDACTQGAEVQPSRGARARALEQVNLLLEPKLVSYTVHCLRDGEPERKPAAKGGIRVLRSRGIDPPPATPPENAVSADGKSYSAMYQNLAPVIDFAWPNAPKAKGYVLYVASRGGAEKATKLRAAKYRFESGKLDDGTHKLRFATDDAAHRSSAVTTVVVSFDNAAPAASVDAPPPAGFAPGPAVAVAGLVTEGTSVTVGGTALRVKDGRFSTTVNVPPTQRALVVRTFNRRHGVRYYVRRAQGAR